MDEPMTTPEVASVDAQAAEPPPLPDVERVHRRVDDIVAWVHAHDGRLDKLEASRMAWLDFSESERVKHWHATYNAYLPIAHQLATQTEDKAPRIMSRTHEYALLFASLAHGKLTEQLVTLSEHKAECDRLNNIIAQGVQWQRETQAQLDALKAAQS